MTVLDGVVAGAAGTTALNAVTYLDIALRARPASHTPEETVRKLAEAADIKLGPEDRAANRRSGLGALLGYVTGTCVAAALAGPVGRRIPTPAAAVILGAAAMTAADLPMAALKVTDPRRWGAAGWLSDVVPHLVYGFVTATVWRRLASADNGSKRRWWTSPMTTETCDRRGRSGARRGSIHHAAPRS